MRESLINRIKRYLAAQKREIELSELYNALPDQKPTTIRGRINENVGSGITRVAKGLYISSEHIVEHASILERIDAMRTSGMRYEFIFLDIPYKSAGQKGGKRDIAKFDTISVDEFQRIVDGLDGLLTEDGTIQFMITSGSSSKREVDKYIECFHKSGYNELKRGRYVKMNGNGTECNIGKYKLPAELIIIYSKNDVDVSGWDLNMTEVRTLGYPTQKPVSMMKKLIQQATKVGQWILDPFGGSGATLKACIELDRRCHIMDVSENAIYILPILGLKTQTNA